MIKEKKNVLDSIIYECKCKTADPQFGYVETLLELKQRYDYLEGVVYNLLAHKYVVLKSTLACPESHPIDFYQLNYQVSHILNIEGFGFTLIAFLLLLQEYLHAQNNHNNKNFGVDCLCTLRVSEVDIYYIKTPPNNK